MRRMIFVAALVILAFGVAGATLDAQAETGTLVINVVDTEGNRLAGACYRFPFPRPTAYIICDNEDPDVDSSEGRIEVRPVAAGWYEMYQNVAPDGYQLLAGDNQIGIEVRGGEVTKVDVVYRELSASNPIADLTERIEDLEVETQLLRERVSQLEQQRGAATGGDVVTTSPPRTAPIFNEILLDCDIFRGPYADSGNPYDKDYQLVCRAP